MTSKPLALLLLAGLLAAPAAAQLDLPGESRAKPRKHKVRGLDLPDAPARPARPSAPEPEAETASPPPGPSGPSGTALAVFARLRELREPRAPAVAAAVAELGELGEPGLAAARTALLSDRPAECLAAVRLLLGTGRAADRERVLERLRGTVPSRGAGPILDALAELDPVGASPGFLLELLEHRQTAVRAAADAKLSELVSPALLPALERRLAAERTDTRLRVLDLLAEIDDPRARDLAFTALGDGRARVADRAARLLARADDTGGERIVERLLALVTEEPSLLREGSYALLALVEREDQRGEAYLGPEHVELLLANLTGGNDLSRSAAACALAGIGFRMPGSDGSTWLDLLVPHHLVRAVAATTFHRDFGSVQGPAQRRLELIAGFTLGSDGPAWQRWWSEAAPTFRARRASIAVGPEDLARIWLVVRERPGRTGYGGAAFALAGELAPEPEETETFYLSHAECADLRRALEREGALTSERLPSTFPVRRPDHELVVGVGRDEKRFATLGDPEPWLARLTELARSLREANLWQRWRDPAAHADRRALWEAERDFWSETTDPVARGRREVALVLAALDGADAGTRDRALDQLERLFDRGGVCDARDVRPLAELLRSAELRPDEVSRLVGLALTAALADAVQGPGLAWTIDAELGRDLAGVLTGRFGAAAAEDVARVLDASPPALTLDLLASPEAGLRAGATLALGARADAAAGARIAERLEDEDEAVVCAAVTAAGRHLRARGDAAERELADAVVRRTTDASPRVRAAAFAAVPETGDARAVGALLRGLSDEDLEARVAAAEGMAALNDPETVPILVSMLARGTGSELFGPAREGLVALGSHAHVELMRAMRRRQPEAAPLAREAALILAEGGAAEAVSPLLSILTDHPDDERVAAELAVLTCVDFRGHPDPAGAWWSWWDLVVHDDSIAWLAAAGARAGLEPPPVEAFHALGGRGDRAAAAFLFDVARGAAPHVAERARRELARRTTTELPSDPPGEPTRERALREAFLAEWAE